MEISQQPSREPRKGDQISGRVFASLLLAIAVAGLIPRLWLGIVYNLGYDNAWHIFIATQDRWELLLSEWKKVAHPWLYYVLLRYVAKLGHANLIYRALSIIPGVETIYLLGQVAAKAYKRRTVALLAAGGCAFSISLIALDSDVRAYPLALFFTVAALYCLVTIVKHSFGAGSAPLAIAFGVLTSLAISSEYYAVFFFLACVGTLVALLLRLPEMRRAALPFLRCQSYAIGLALGLPACVCGWLFLYHVRYQPRSENNVMQFYWHKGTSMLRFLSNNWRNNLNFISPIELGSGVAIVLLCLLFALVVWWFLVLQARSEDTAAFSIWFILLLIVSELIVLSLLGLYPFGGMARQQSILFPFFILTAFSLVDRIASYIPVGWARNGLLLVTAMAIAASFFIHWRKVPNGSEAIAAREYDEFRKRLPKSNVVYVDQFSLIAYYIRTQHWQWKFERHFREPDRVDEYKTTSPTGEQVRVIRNIDQWNFDLLKPGFYATLSRSLRDAHQKGANLFFLKQDWQAMDSATLQRNQTRIRDLAAHAGLRVEGMYYESRLAAIAFEIESTGTPRVAKGPGSDMLSANELSPMGSARSAKLYYATATRERGTGSSTTVVRRNSALVSIVSTSRLSTVGFATARTKI